MSILTVHFVSSNIYQKAVQLALSEGLSEELFKHHQEIEEIKNSSRYVPIKCLFEIYELARENLKAGFSIRQGKQLRADDYGTLGLSWKTCWTLKDVLLRTSRFMLLVTDNGSAKVIEAKDKISIKIIRDPLTIGLEMANETTFVMLINILNEIAGEEIRPSFVFFQHKSIESDQFAEFFKCEVEFGSGQNLMEFNSSDLAKPANKADESLQAFLIERMEEEENEIYVNIDKFLKDVYKIVNETLPSGIPSLIECAEHLGMSPRTFKRRLADKKLSFREIIQESQQKTSQYLLKNSTQTIAEIAFQIGFSEQSAFNRAFKRWTGSSPLEYRNTK